MARQAGPHYITGLFIGFSYYKTKFGYLSNFIPSRAWPRWPKLRNKQPRSNNARLGGASKAAALVRDTFQGTLELVDRRLKYMKAFPQ